MRTAAAVAKPAAQLPSHNNTLITSITRAASTVSPLRGTAAWTPRLTPVARQYSANSFLATASYAIRWITTIRSSSLPKIKELVASSSSTLPITVSRNGLRSLHTSVRRPSAAAGLAFTPSNPTLSSAPTTGVGPSAVLGADDPPMLFDASHLLTGQQEEKKERLRCLEVDDNGNYRHVEFSRAELGAMLELHPRDLRFLDSSMRNLPSILARRRVIIVNMEVSLPFLRSADTSRFELTPALLFSCL